MINTRILINGNEEEIQLFKNMFEYVTHYGSDISHYSIMLSDDHNFVIDDENFIDDEDFIIGEEINFEGETYIHVNWGEKERSYINEKGLYQILYTIYQKTEEMYFHQHKFQNFKSLIFESEEDAMEKVEELQPEHANIEGYSKTKQETNKPEEINFDEFEEIEIIEIEGSEIEEVRRQVNGVWQHKHTGYDYWHPITRIHKSGDQMIYIETSGWLNDSEWECKIKDHNPINETPLQHKSDYFSSYTGWIYKTANRHIFEFRTMEDAEECIERIEKYRNSEQTNDPFEKGKCILGED